MCVCVCVCVCVCGIVIELAYIRKYNIQYSFLQM